MSRAARAKVASHLEKLQEKTEHLHDFSDEAMACEFHKWCSNLQQNADYMGPVSGNVPALLQSSNLWLFGKRRLALPMEHLEVQGWNVWGNNNSYKGVDLHQALTIDRASSRDRAPIGLVRCICKDDYVKGKHAHVKFKLSNIHAFVPVWMAPMMLKNFRLIAAQSSPVSPLGQLDYREGWFAIIPKEGQPGETLCGIQVHLNDKSLAEFPNRDWPAIEHWAEKGLLKPDVWKARRTNLSLIVKLEIPISGTAIQIQQQALQLDQVPDSWPCNLESGWAAHYGRLDMPFEALCQHLVQNQFTSDAFQGDSDSYLFQWDTNVWDTWPEVEGQNFKEDWDKEGHINQPKRSETILTTDDIQQLQRDTPAHNELRAPMNQFMERQFANQEPLRNNLLIPTLESRIIQAAKLRGALAQMVHAISRNFTIRDTNQIMEQLILRCQGDLNVYIQNEMLMHNHCMEIVGSLGLKMLDAMLSVDD